MKCSVRDFTPLTCPGSRQVPWMLAMIDARQYMENATRSSQSSNIVPLVRRVCSGGCSFFQARYADGRKMAGAGTCEHHLCSEPVQVGMKCLWARPTPAPAPTSRGFVAVS